MEDKFESAALLMPTVALRGLVVFPGMQVHFDVGREKSIDALKAALAGDRKIFLTAQKDIAVDDPDFNDLYKLGVVATVSRVAKLPGEGDIVRVSVKGMYRARLNGIVSSEPHLVGAIRACAELSEGSVHRCGHYGYHLRARYFLTGHHHPGQRHQSDTESACRLR